MAKTILFADDSASMRQLVEFSLKEAGYSIITAVNGKDALTKLESSSADMVITDLNMPEMDGITFIKNLRQKAGHKFTPVVMLTTESKEDKKNEGIKAGASGWIVKPFKPDQLTEVVKRFLK